VDTLDDARDRAIVLTGFAGAFRRSEIVGIRLEDLTWTDAGVTVNLRTSKTDQEGKGRLVGIASTGNAHDPVQALRTWLNERALLKGAGENPFVFPAFTGRGGWLREGHLTPQEVALIVKEGLRRIGVDPARYSGHSLRAGHVTTALEQDNVSIQDLMLQTGHTNLNMLLRYRRVKPEDVLKHTTSRKVGL
jgi:integrase